MDKTLTFTEAIFELDSCDEVYATISKEYLKALYDEAHCPITDEDGVENPNYISGEVQYMFTKDTDVVDEILLFPVYESEEDDGVYNGDFIDVTTELWETRNEAIEFLKSKKK